MPADTQPLGMVHGGVLLSLMEEAGELHCTRYCSQHHTYDDARKHRQPVARLAYVERVQFVRPVTCGQLMQVETELIYTSLHSLRILVSVYAADLKVYPSSWAWTSEVIEVRWELGGHLACSAWLWYVPADIGDDNKIVEVPPLHQIDQQLYDQGKLTYKALKDERQKRQKQSHFVTSKELLGNSDYLITSSHCGHQSTCKGGPIMRWMDENAGIAAILHCGFVLVTASIDSMRFYSTVQIGSLLSVVSRPVFASERGIDLYTVVYEQEFDLGDSDTVVYQTIADGFVTYAAAAAATQNAEMDSLRIPEVFPESDEDKAMYEVRRKLYLERRESNS